jgi:hypothetical protein
MIKLLVRLVLGLAVAAVAIQFVPYGHDHTNPPVGQEAPWPDAAARELAVGACYDCHSNETKWPLYTNVAPFSWLTLRHVRQGRDALNFSDWANQRDRHELADAVENGSMPPRSYKLIHADARLSASERARLVDALKQMEGGGGGSGRRSGRGGG